jgi:hypothetical protein
MEVESNIENANIIRYCWLNINNGEFSNSWDIDSMKYIDRDMLKLAKEDGWKLIKYECLTDDDFEFYNKMQLGSMKSIKTKKYGR